MIALAISLTSIYFAYTANGVAKAAASDAHAANVTADEIRKSGVSTQVLLVGGIAAGRPGGTIELGGGGKPTLQRVLTGLHYEIQNYSRLPVTNVKFEVQYTVVGIAKEKTRIWDLGDVYSCNRLSIQKYVSSIANQIVVEDATAFELSAVVIYTDPAGVTWSRSEQATPHEMDEAALDKVRDIDKTTDVDPPRPAEMTNCAPA